MNANTNEILPKQLENVRWDVDAMARGFQQPSNEFKSPRDVFDRTLEHERQITQKINGLYEAAAGEKDYATQTFLQWFISEQVEEEARVVEYVEKLKLIGESSNAIFWIDKELGKRER